MADPEEKETHDDGPEELIIQQKIYDMIMYAYPALEQFPKSQKFSLAQDMKKCLDEIMRYTIMANKKYTKKTTLLQLDVELAALKVYMRIARDLNYLPYKKYGVWSKMAVEVGRMIDGWIKATREGQPIDKQMSLPLPEDDEEFNCSECGAVIVRKIKDYSEKHFGRALCYKCQRKHKSEFKSEFKSEYKRE